VPRPFRKGGRGQAAVEFVLLAPLLFLLFFALIQATYFAFACFAVQRAALAAARHASRSDGTGGWWDQPRAQVDLSLAPLLSLNWKAQTASILATKVGQVASPIGVTVKVRYPMPIWVPLAGRWFGKPLVPVLDLKNNEAARILRLACQFLGRSAPDLSFDGIRLPYYRMLEFEATAVDESNLKAALP